MKWPVVLVICLCGIAYAAWHYHYRTLKQPIQMDTIISAVSPVKELLPPNANISFNGLHTDLQIFVWSRYALAPRHLAWHYGRYDTMLSVSPLQYKDSLLLQNKTSRVLWQHSDTQYYYLLTAR